MPKPKQEPTLMDYLTSGLDWYFKQPPEKQEAIRDLANGAGRVFGIGVDKSNGATTKGAASRLSSEEQRRHDAAMLRVRPDCTIEQLKRAYREGVKVLHSDHGGDDASFVAFKMAYDRALKWPQFSTGKR
jgi:hypothetical protein